MKPLNHSIQSPDCGNHSYLSKNVQKKKNGIAKNDYTVICERAEFVPATFLCEGDEPIPFLRFKFKPCQQNRTVPFSLLL